MHSTRAWTPSSVPPNAHRELTMRYIPSWVRLETSIRCSKPGTQRPTAGFPERFGKPLSGWAHPVFLPTLRKPDLSTSRVVLNVRGLLAPWLSSNLPTSGAILQHELERVRLATEHVPPKHGAAFLLPVNSSSG